MLRLTFTLCAALWASFTIWGEPTESETVALAESPATSAPIIETAQSYFDTPTVVTDSTTAPTIVSRNVAPSVPRLVGEPLQVSLIQPEAKPEPVEIASSVEDLPPLYEVTGNRVNMRSGPSTGNRVVGALTRGTLAEAIGEPVNGWMEIRDVETGLTGYMSAKFLSAL